MGRIALYCAISCEAGNESAYKQNASKNEEREISHSHHIQTCKRGERLSIFEFLKFVLFFDFWVFHHMSDVPSHSRTLINIEIELKLNCPLDQKHLSLSDDPRSHNPTHVFPSHAFHGDQPIARNPSQFQSSRGFEIPQSSSSPGISREPSQYALQIKKNQKCRLLPLLFALSRSLKRIRL